MWIILECKFVLIWSWFINGGSSDMYFLLLSLLTLLALICLSTWGFVSIAILSDGFMLQWYGDAWISQVVLLRWLEPSSLDGLFDHLVSIIVIWFLILMFMIYEFLQSLPRYHLHTLLLVNVGWCQSRWIGSIHN